MRVRFENESYELLPGETLLTGLGRQGVQLPYFCRTGVCQTCLVRATRGQPPARSQAGVAAPWVERGCFLACQCVPDQPLEVERCDVVGTFDSRVARVEALSARVLRVELEVPAGFEYRAGQFLQLERMGGVMRPYSIASLPGSPYLELHVALFPGGAMSEWLQSAAGKPVTLRGPFGECFYLDSEPERPLLLAGTGTGLAPLLGVVRAALAGGPPGADSPVSRQHQQRRPLSVAHAGAAARGGSAAARVRQRARRASARRAPAHAGLAPSALAPAARSTDPERPDRLLRLPRLPVRRSRSGAAAAPARVPVWRSARAHPLRPVREASSRVTSRRGSAPRPRGNDSARAPTPQRSPQSLSVARRR
jgi:ferredoxin-NADP reductase/ferredoxin